MISRYQSKDMKMIWSDESKYQAWFEIELAVSKAWQQMGVITEDVFQAIAKGIIDVNDISKLEAIYHHDVIAFTRSVSKSIDFKAQPWFHYGLTSTDVVDSANSLRLRRVNDLLESKMDQLMIVIKEKALKYKNTKTIGRTHGIHAEITSFGLKFALWYQDLTRIKKTFLLARKHIEVIKISGAVGNYFANHPNIEISVGKILNMDYADVSTQVLQRDRHAQYLSSIALVASQLEKIALEIRHLSRTEVSEVCEFFDEHQKGSSAMPHKRNPVLSENITGLARVIRGYMITGFENIALWHERDISHSSAERIILEDATTLLDYMLTRTTNIISKLVVNQDKMLENIELTYGVIYAQALLNACINKQVNRERAYDMIQKEAFKAIHHKVHLKQLLKENKQFTDILDEDELETAFDSNQYLKHVDHIYHRIFKNK